MAFLFDFWPVGPVLRITFVQYFIAFCSRPEVTSDIISGNFVGTVVPDNHVKFDDPCLNGSPEFPPQALDAVFSHVFRRNAIAFRTIGKG